MANVSKLANGLFILGALALMIAMLFVFGMSDFFTRKARIVTTYRESIQGLSIGSPVKYKGVTIGSVDDISIRVQDKIIQIGMKIELKPFNFGKQPEMAFDKFLAREVPEGLRCRLEFAGITGLRYMELDYYDKPGEVFAADVELPPGAVYVPSTPSVFKDLAKSLNVSLERISRIRFEEISDNLVKSLTDINRLLSSEELQTTIRHLRSMAVNLDQASGAVNRSLTEERLKQILAQLEKTLNSTAALTDQLSRDVKKSDIAKSTEAFRSAAVAVREAAISVDDRRNDAALALDKLNATLDSLRELIDSINADPASLLSGRRQKPLPEDAR